VTSGGKVFDRWKAPKLARVLFIDGEMPASTLQERLASLIAGSDSEPPGNDYLRILTPDMQDSPMPNLSTLEGQESVEPFLAGVDLVVIDNLATLARHGRANDEESWLPIQTWLLQMRWRGISVLMIHHQGKGGDQRGTSAKEDILDTVIRLDRPNDYHSEQGARFEVHLAKARGICGDDAKSFEAQLLADGQALTWATRDIEDVELEQVRKLLDEGFSIRDTADELGISTGKVQRLKKKLDTHKLRISSGAASRFSIVGEGAE
jgi:putative DNA primase/helicase